MLILNLGSGKIESKDATIKIDGDVTIFVDRSYDMGYCSTIRDIEEKVISLANGYYLTSNLFIAEDIFSFMDKFKFKFDKIIANRIFEHMEYCGGEIGRLLEACNVSSIEDATLEIVVPNAIKLVNMILEYENSKNFNVIQSSIQKLIINTEMCNCKSDCHASVWTPRLAKEYIESEGTWQILNIDEDFHMAGRNIYMKIICSKIV